MALSSRLTRRIVKPILFFACLVPVGGLVYGLYSDTVYGTQLLTADPVQKLDRELGEWTLLFLTATLAIRPIGEIFGRKDLVAYRRMIGLFAFFYAVLHVTSYTLFNNQLNGPALVEDVLKRPFITIGMLAFALLIPLAITSTKGMIKRLGARAWRRLHQLIYPAAILGVIHFTMMIRADYSRPVIYGTVIAALLGYRWWRWRRDEAARSTTAPA